MNQINSASRNVCEEVLTSFFQLSKVVSDKIMEMHIMINIYEIIVVLFAPSSGATVPNSLQFFVTEILVREGFK